MMLHVIGIPIFYAFLSLASAVIFAIRLWWFIKRGAKKSARRSFLILQSSVFFLFVSNVLYAAAAVDFRGYRGTGNITLLVVLDLSIAFANLAFTLIIAFWYSSHHTLTNQREPRLNQSSTTLTLTRVLGSSSSRLTGASGRRIVSSSWL